MLALAAQPEAINPKPKPEMRYPKERAQVSVLEELRFHGFGEWRFGSGSSVSSHADAEDL